MSTSTTTTTEDRALTLLGQGVPPQAVANALGVDISRISQLLSNDDFAQKVVEKKFESLSKHNERDSTIDALEDKLLETLKHSLCMMTRPMEIIKAFSVINAAKRRGQSAPEALTAKQTVLQLNLPPVLIQHFTKNIHNQVIQVDSQSLLTIPSANLRKTVEAQNVSPRTGSLPAPTTTETNRSEQRTSA
jgi:hypothetical protein